jgi:hypothetical protein
MTFDASQWQGILDDMVAQSGGSGVYFLKEKTTRLRLVLADSTELPRFWADTEKHYKGKVTTAHLVHAVILKTSKDGDENANPNKVAVIRMPKTVLRGIIGNLAEGFELFDPKLGHGITVERSGGGTAERTNYNVKVSPKPVAVSEDLEWPERSLEELAEAETKRAKARDAKNATGADEGGETDEGLPF